MGLTLLGTATAGAADANLEISSISGGYTDLYGELWGNSQHSTVDNWRMRVGNGTVDTGSNYNWASAYSGSGTGQSGSASDTAITDSHSLLSNAVAETPDYLSFVIFNYASVTAAKNIYVEGYSSRAVTTNHYMSKFTGQWETTGSAIDVVRFYLANANWTQGSVLKIYGRFATA